MKCRVLNVAFVRKVSQRVQRVCRYCRIHSMQREFKKVGTNTRVCVFVHLVGKESILCSYSKTLSYSILLYLFLLVAKLILVEIRSPIRTVRSFSKFLKEGIAKSSLEKGRAKIEKRNIQQNTCLRHFLEIQYLEIGNKIINLEAERSYIVNWILLLCLCCSQKSNFDWYIRFQLFHISIFSTCSLGIDISSYSFCS